MTARVVASVPPRDTLGGGRGWAVLQAGASVVLVAGLLAVFGAEPFVMAVRSVDLTGVLIALGTGLVAVAAQADRWRTIARGYAAAPRRRDALALTYQATFLNMVLPGGIAGDAVRALRHPDGEGRRVRTGLAVVAVERLLGTAVVVLGATVAVAVQGRMPWLVLVGLLVTAVLVGLIWPGLRRASAGRLLRAVLASVLLWAALMTLFAHAATSAVPELEVADALPLGAVCLGAMAIPLNVGGWGPRESVTAVAAMMWGFLGRDGVSAAAAYGVLALVGSLPGAVLVLTDLARRRSGGLRPLRRSRGGFTQDELGAHVAAQHEAADGRA